MPLPASQNWRDFATPGVPSSGRHRPLKTDLRDWGTWVEAEIAALLAGTATGVAPEVIRLNHTIGTGKNLIRVTTATARPAAALGALYLLEWRYTNDGPVRIEVNGEASVPVLGTTGSDLPAGFTAPGLQVLALDMGDHYRLLTGDDAAAVQAAVDAATARAAADTAATRATNEASRAKDEADRAANATGFDPADYVQVEDRGRDMPRAGFREPYWEVRTASASPASPVIEMRNSVPFLANPGLNRVDYELRVPVSVGLNVTGIAGAVDALSSVTAEMRLFLYSFDTAGTYLNVVTVKHEAGLGSFAKEWTFSTDPNAGADVTVPATTREVSLVWSLSGDATVDRVALRAIYINDSEMAPRLLGTGTGASGSVERHVTTATGDGTATRFALSGPPPVNAALCDVTLDGIAQHVDAYALDGDVIEFTEAVPPGVAIEVRHGAARTSEVGVPSDLAVTEGKVATDAIGPRALAPGAVRGEHVDASDREALLVAIGVGRRELATNDETRPAITATAPAYSHPATDLLARLDGSSGIVRMVMQVSLERGSATHVGVKLGLQVYDGANYVGVPGSRIAECLMTGSDASIWRGTLTVDANLPAALARSAGARRWTVRPILWVAYAGNSVTARHLAIDFTEVS